jgi:multidrug efflux system membrane fusion protein
VIYTLPQQQLAQINAAQARGPVTVEALDADGKTVLDRGTLQVVDNQVDQTTGTVRMKAEFPNTNLQLWPGQFVNVRILTETLSQVVVIPTPAVQRGPNGTFAYVVQEDQRVVLRPITVGLQTETTAVVGKGIAASERVVTTGFSRLKDGARVAVVRAEDPPASPPAGADATKGAATTAKSEAREKTRTACAADVQKFCPNVERGRDGIRECLQAHAAELSDSCKAAGAGQKGGKAREADARKPEGSSPQ